MGWKEGEGDGEPSPQYHCVTPAPAGSETELRFMVVLLPVSMLIRRTLTVPLNGKGASFAMKHAPAVLQVDS